MRCSSQILGDRLELSGAWGVAGAGQGVVEAMVDMVLNQRAFGLRDGLFNSMKLLGDVGAGALCLNHPDYTQKMPVGTFQPLDDIGVGCMVGVFCHKQRLSPLGG